MRFRSVWRTSIETDCAAVAIINLKYIVQVRDIGTLLLKVKCLERNTPCKIMHLYITVTMYFRTEN